MDRQATPPAGTSRAATCRSSLAPCGPPLPGRSQNTLHRGPHGCHPARRPDHQVAFQDSVEQQVVRGPCLRAAGLQQRRLADGHHRHLCARRTGLPTCPWLFLLPLGVGWLEVVPRNQDRGPDILPRPIRFPGRRRRRIAALQGPGIAAGSMRCPATWTPVPTAASSPASPWRSATCASRGNCVGSFSWSASRVVSVTLVGEISDLEHAAAISWCSPWKFRTFSQAEPARTAVHGLGRPAFPGHHPDPDHHRAHQRPLWPHPGRRRAHRRAGRRACLHWSWPAGCVPAAGSPGSRPWSWPC